ncbi:uncharacterized protein [Periplaneta americana]|uniref:uncharacterized protein n=1 Tax=Periplaneta americana TaxID=6978 RepID=UPI0037E81A12
MAASRKCDYKKTGGSYSISGAMYEVKLSGLLFLRGVNEGQDFRIASNMEAGGKFDDIVFSFGGTTTFVQLKHKAGTCQTVTERKLAAEKGDFSIPMYYKSYCELKNKWGQHPDLQHWGPFRDVRFVVYTNAAMTRTLGENVDDTALHDVLMTGGECIHFSGYDLLKDKPEANQFLHQFRYYTEQATEKQLDQFIKAEIQTALGTDSHLEKFLSNVKNWWEGPGSYLTEDVEFWEQMVECSIADICKAKADQLSLLNVRFDERYLKSFRQQLPAEGGLLIVKNVNALTSLKVHQSVEKKIMIDANVLQDRMSEVLALWDRWDILVVNGWAKEIAELHKHLGSRKMLIEIHDGEKTDRKTLIDAEKLIERKTFSEIHDGEKLKERKTLIEIHDGEKLIERKTIIDTHDSEKIIERKTVTEIHDSEKMIERNIVTEIHDGEKMVEKETLTEIHDGGKMIGFKFRSHTDTFRFDQMDKETKEKVLECKLKFQGEFVKLKSLVDIRTFDEAVSAEIVIQVVSGNVEGIGKELTKQYEYYIPRTFLRREHVDRRIFFAENDCMVVSGVTQRYLQQLVPPGKFVEIFDETKHNETSYCRHFVGRKMDFEMATKVYNCVHWLYKEETGFVWRQSKGGVTNIIRHLTHEPSNRSLREAMLLSDKVKVLVAHPGMGKSTEIINLAHEFKRNDPACWVVTVVLNDHTDYLSGHQVSVIDLLIDAAKFDSAFQKSLFEFELKNGGNIVILIDGFDEISPNYSDMVLNTLRQLTAYKFKQLWITSRSVTRKMLEKEFSCLAFELQPFTKENQHDFLAKLWKNISDGPYDINIFIARLLEVIGRSLNDKLGQFTEIPLQILMLAEVFQSKASDYCQTGNIEIPDKLDLLDLYCRFVDKKWNIYINEKGEGNTTKLVLQEVYQSQRKVLEENHMACALHSLLEREDFKKLSCFHNIMSQVTAFQSRFYQGLEKIGIIVEIVNFRSVFIHRTFSEYFAAKWFAKNIKKEKKYLEKLLFDQKFKVIRTFFHRILSQGFQLHVAVLNEDKVSLLELLHSQRCDVNKKDKGGRTPLHLAVMNHIECHHEYHGNYEAIRNTTTHEVLEILLDHGADCSIEDEVLCCQPLTLADRFGAWSVVEKVLERHAQSSDISFSLEHIKSKELLDINLKMVAEGGYINIAKFLFNSGVSVQHPVRVKSNWEWEVGIGTMVHVAAIAGKVEMVEFLLNATKKELKDSNMTYFKKADDNSRRYNVNMLFHRDEYINIRDNMDNTALSYAARHGHVQTVTLLIDRGADCNLRNKDGDSPIFLAAQNGHVEVVRLLIDRGIDVNACNQHGENLLFTAAKHGDVELTTFLIDRGINVHARNKNGDSLISSAVEYGRVNIVNLLTEAHGIDVNARDNYGNSLTFIAAKFGHDDVVNLLIQKGADINARNKLGESPLFIALKLWYGHGNIERLLIERGANVNVRTNDGITPILVAVERGLLNAVWMLIEKNADVNVRNKLGETPIMMALKHGHEDILKLLLEKGVDINARTNDGVSLAIATAKRGLEKLTMLLIERGADVNARTKDGVSLVMAAAKRGLEKLTILLVERGADVNARTKDGVSLVMAAAENGLAEVVSLLIDKGANINKRNKHGQSPILIAALHNHQHIMWLLAENGADVNVCDKDGITPIMVAAEYCDLETVRMLIEKNADVNARGKRGECAILNATIKWRVDVVRLLVEHGAAVNVCNKYGESPMSIAVKHRHESMVRLLTEAGAVNQLETFYNRFIRYCFSCHNNHRSSSSSSSSSSICNCC